MNKKMLIGICIFASLILMLIPTVNAGVENTTYTDSFETDTKNTNPTADWYTYEETGFAYANVTDLTHRTAGDLQGFSINDTSSASTERCYFNFTSHAYDYFEFYFKWDNYTGNITYGALSSTDGALIDIKFSPTTDTLEVYNYTKKGILRVLSNQTWYKLKIIFDYSNNTINARLYDNASVLLNNSWMEPYFETGLTTFTDVTSFWLYGSTGVSASLDLDEFALNWNRFEVVRLDWDNMTNMFYSLVVAIFSISIIVILFKNLGKLFN